MVKVMGREQRFSFRPLCYLEWKPLQLGFILGPTFQIAVLFKKLIFFI